MKSRIRLLIAAVAVAALGTIAAPPAEAAKGKAWCMTYCDTIHLGCQKTVGWFDQQACEDWKKGCLDGCRVND
ncbi:MAG: hypothetical protein KAI98_01595 [Gemmatimonadetes bacterium]|nr:hypothetical protein [Gemmatimonadota bacterium]